jgi:hypothetical protein
MSPTSYIGAKLFYLGFRMQPLRIRRAISLLLSIGLKWSEKNDDILIRVMRGEHLDIAIDFTSEAASKGDGGK